MRTSRFGVKSLFNIIYATIILLPMFSVFGRLIYTQSNPNAKNSYSDRYVENLTLVNNTDLLIPNSDYYVSYNANNTNQYNQIWNVNSTSLSSVASLQDNQYITTIVMLNDNGTPRINLTLNDGTTQRIMNWQNVVPSFTFNLNSTTQNTFNTNFASLYLITLQNQTLDNAFEYSLSEFTKDNNLGGVDLFGWFTNMFLNQSNQKNALYLNFINWYMNYTLLVSAGYLIFLALIWFINYVRKILDQSMYHDFGGF